MAEPGNRVYVEDRTATPQEEGLIRSSLDQEGACLPRNEARSVIAAPFVFDLNEFFTPPFRIE